MHPNSIFRSDAEHLAPLFVREIGFAAIFGATPDGPRVAHAPILLDDEGKTLRFHLSRGNALSRHIEKCSLLAVVQGPDAYVSANWYPSVETSVPTWNYVAVEMEGNAQALDSAGLVTLLDDLSALHEERIGETPPWTRAKMDPLLFTKMTGAITGFEMRITAWRPTFKLSQNKPVADRRRLADRIEATGHGALAHLMREIGGAKEDE